MSQLWPSISSSKRTNDSTRRSSSKINQLKLSLGLNSPKSYSNVKGTPNHLISTSILSSVSSIHKNALEKQASLSRRSFRSYSNIANKCSYRLDAAMLIVGRIRKFIYKHFHIWRLAAGRSITAEKRTHSHKSLVIQVTVSREKKRFHSISRSSVEQNNWSQSPKPVVKEPSLKLQDLESVSSSKVLQSLNSQKTLFKKQFKSFTNDERQLFSFDYGPVRPVTRNFAYSGIDKRKKLEKFWNILSGNYRKSINDGFFTIFAVFILKLNFLKVLASLSRRLRVRMKRNFNRIVQEGENIRKGLFICRAMKDVGKRTVKGYFRSIILHLNVKIGPKGRNIKDSYESLRKSIQEICLSSSRNSGFRKNPRIYHKKAEKFLETMKSFYFSHQKRLKTLVLSQIQSKFPYIKKKGIEKLFKFLQNSFQSSSLKSIKKYCHSKQLKKRIFSQFLKKISKTLTFLIEKCFDHWKTQTKIFSSKDLPDLKAKTFESTFSSISKQNLLFAFLSLKYFRRASRVKTSRNFKLLTAFKRITKHLNFFKSKSFQKLKHFRGDPRVQNESEAVLISHLVRILKFKILRNFRHFFAKVSQFN